MGESIRHTLRLVELVAEGQAPLEELRRDYRYGYPDDATDWVADAFRSTQAAHDEPSSRDIS